jgi:hypothetical protein
MALFVKITSPKVWAQGDYTDNATHDINMTIYSDPQMQNTVDLTAFTTITMRLIDPNFNGRLVWDSTTGVTGNASGVLTWQPTSGSTIYTKGTLKVRPRFQDSTQKLTAIGVNGSDEIYVKTD